MKNDFNFKMKKIPILLLSILVFEVSYSQNLNGIDSSKTKKECSENDTIPRVVYSNPKTVYTKEEENNKPLIFLNGKFIGNESVSANQIESIKVVNGKFKFNGKEYNGKLLITSKPGYKTHNINLTELVKKYTKLNTDNLIFSIDGNVINANKNEVFVDEKNVMQIKVERLDKIEKNKGLYFISILTRTPENLKKVNTIKIRGSELSLNN